MTLNHHFNSVYGKVHVKQHVQVLKEFPIGFGKIPLFDMDIAFLSHYYVFIHEAPKNITMGTTSANSD